MTYLKESALELCPVLEEELSILRSVLENNISNEKNFSPMLTFFSDPTTRKLAVVTKIHDNFIDTLSHISSALFLYPAINAHHAIVSMYSEIHDDDGNKTAEAINSFLISEDYGIIITMQYTVSNNTVTWLYDNFECVSISDAPFTGISKEMANMLFMYTHMEKPVYTVQELLSYLSYSGAAVHQFGEQKVTYYHMSEISNEQ